MQMRDTSIWLCCAKSSTVLQGEVQLVLNLTAHHRHGCTTVAFLSFALSGGVNAGSSSHSSLTSQAALYFIPETREYKCTGSPINRSSQPPKRPVDWATTGVPEAYTEATLRAVDLK